MDRRNFMKLLAIAAGGPTALANLPISAPVKETFNVIVDTACVDDSKDYVVISTWVGGRCIEKRKIDAKLFDDWYWHDGPRPEGLFYDASKNNRH